MRRTAIATGLAVATCALGAQSMSVGKTVPSPEVIVCRSDRDWEQKALHALRHGRGYCILRGGLEASLVRRLQRETSSSSNDAGDHRPGCFADCHQLLNGTSAPALMDV